MPQSAPQVETSENRRKRLKFRSWHRGTREMDLLMGSFADRYVMTFTENQLDQYEELLNCEDPDLYNWMIGKEKPPQEQECEVLALLLTHRFAT